MNAYDYLRWRGDIPFSQWPFNEIDALICSQICYLRWDRVLSYARKIRLKDAVAQYREKRDEELVRQAGDMNPRREKLVYLAAETARYSNARLMYYHREFSPESEKQFQALTIFLPDGTYYVSYEGTDATIVGWKEDFNMTFLCPIPSQLSAAVYLKKVMQDTRFGHFRIGGHSKGGNLAIYAAARSESQKRIRQIYNFDGPGFPQEFLQEEGYQQIRDRITTLIPSGSIIGRLLNNDSDTRIVKSEASRLIWQHDVTSWQVDFDHFVLTDRNTADSVFIEQTMNRWNREVSRQDKMVFLDTIYETIASFNITTAVQLRENRQQVLMKLLSSLPNYDEATRGVILEVVSILFKSNAITFYNNFVEKHINKLIK